MSMPNSSPSEKQNKTELTRKAMIGLKAEATARGKSMKEVASELILAGISPQARAFVSSITHEVEELPARPSISEIAHEVKHHESPEQPPAISAQPKKRATKNQPPIEYVPGLGERILTLRKEGKSHRAIAATVGYSKTAVQHYLSKVGVT